MKNKLSKEDKKQKKTIMKYNSIPDFITLDKETAIKLVRILKREISKIQD